MPIPIESSLVHGIYDADVKNAPLFSDCGPMLNDFIEGCDLAGYNSNKFDIPLLAEEFLRVGIPFTLDGRNTVDVQILFHKLEPRNLSAAFKYYTGGTLENAHAALVDTQATYEVFKGMYEKYKDDERALRSAEQRAHAGEDGPRHAEREQHGDEAADEEEEELLELEPPCVGLKGGVEQVHRAPLHDAWTRAVEEVQQHRNRRRRHAAEEEEVEEGHPRASLLVRYCASASA